MSDVTINIPAKHTERFLELTKMRLEGAAEKLGLAVDGGTKELLDQKDYFGQLHAVYEQADLDADIEVTADVAAILDILDWAVYLAGNALECACQAKERDLGDIRKKLDETRFFVDTLEELREPAMA
jgi:hypothetical protein